jgi:UDP-glucuronate 4-epimerase
MTRIVVTGAAGFIGFHVARRLVSQGEQVLGIDNLNDYYDVTLKEARLAEIGSPANFRFERADLSDRDRIAAAFRDFRPEVVIHLAAQAGVRYSLVNPNAYVDANLVGFTNVLEACRHNRVGHLLFASSSSVYGANTTPVFSPHDRVDHPVSFYAATKIANEMMAHSYAHLFRLPCTGLRFFTVYGPWGRPDMAAFSFAKAITEGRSIDLYNYGQMWRDFTYIDDVVAAVVRLVGHVAQPDPAWNASNPDPATSSAPYRIYNIGNHSPVELMRFVQVLERELGAKAILNLCEIQPGDVLSTCADTADITADTGWEPTTSIEDGLREFVAWFRKYYRAGSEAPAKAEGVPS